MELIHIAVDGPAGAGKSTVAKKVASKFDILHLDTVAMYIAIGLYALKKGIDTQDEEQVKKILEEIDIDVKYTNNKQQTLLNGNDVSANIRTSEVSRAASDVSKWSSVRNKLVLLQQKIAKSISIVMDGRDIGTYVLPDAKYKFYITASVQERAKRRYLELKEKEGENTIYLEDIEKEIIARDYQDMNREVTPLTKADDAILIDTTDLSIEEVINMVLKKIGLS
jgi:cytidylate kinase